MRPQKRKIFIIFICVGMFAGLALLVRWSTHSRGLKTNVVEYTAVPQTTPGIVISGSVRNSNGEGVENVAIYDNYASYPGRLIATTDAAGNYESKFYPIPGDEMVTVWAELSGLQFQPEYCYSRHYYGYEKRTCDFLAQPIEKNN